MEVWIVVVVGIRKPIIVESYCGEGAYFAAKCRCDYYRDQPEYKSDTIYFYPEDYEQGIGTPLL